MQLIILLSIFGCIQTALADVSTPHLCLPSPSEKCFTVIVDQRLNWNDAEKYCEKNLPNGRLASIHNAFDGSVIDPWIGAFQIGSLPFQWTDSSSMDYTHWTSGEPTNQCAQICHSTATNNGILCQQGKWRTADCEKETAQIICEYGNFSSAPATTTVPTPTPTPTLSYTGSDCLELKQKYSNIPSGIYFLTPPGIQGFNAYCDMETDGGGWTVFQRRLNDDISFYDKTWNEYKTGFNNGLDKSLWLGNDNIHVLSTKDSNVEMRIDIWGDRAPGSEHPNIYLYGKYTSFYIDNEANGYAFHLDFSSTGNASNYAPPGQGIYYNRLRKFSTIDRDSSKPSLLCSRSPYFDGGWWTYDCTYGSLNGKYIPNVWNNDDYGLAWNWWYTTNNHLIINPSQTRMMLRKVIS